MIEPPLPPCVAYVPRHIENKLLVVNGDMHGRGFFDMAGNWIAPGHCAYLNRAHFEFLNKRNGFIKCLETSNR
jgi:hypothetical protein